MSQVSAAIGPQKQFNSAIHIVHVLFVVAFSVKAVFGVITNVPGLAMIGGLAGIIISDITIYRLVQSWQGREFVASQKAWSYVLYALAMTDVFGGAVAPAIGMGDAYYGWGMWLLLAGVFTVYVIIAVVVSPAAQADEAEKMSTLQLALAEHRTMIAERRGRADAKLLKAREADAIRQTRWATMEAFYEALMRKPARIGNRLRIGRTAGRAFQDLMGELNTISVVPQLGAASKVTDKAPEIVLTAGGDGQGQPASFR